MTIKEAQGATVIKGGDSLPSLTFSHGQIYAALSRADMPHMTKTIIDDVKNLHS